MVKAKVGCWSSVALASACFYLSVSGQVKAEDGPGQAIRAQAHFRVFNLARVPERDLVRAKAEVGRIFADGGIDVHWAEGDLHDLSSLAVDFSATNSQAGCTGEANRSELRVQLLAHLPHGMPAGTLGFSLPCAKFGTDSTIFIDQCEAVSYQIGPTFARVLGDAIAHELGHVLLRSGQHSRSGLMRARWDEAAWLNAAVGQVRMNQDEARRMRIELLRMEEPSLIAASPR
ncbi:MAG TPA: hypothetical protein VH302_01395 [Bryobacteraceae bacterium]|jgi:hypothetical protein|nr:hypothetical protein [Bryobacteraceae bacterium]